NFCEDGAGDEIKKFRKRFKEALAEGRRRDAVGHCLEMLGLPPEELEGIRQLPMWPMWEAIAPTFGYDAALMGEDGSVLIQRVARITVPTLIMNGGASFPSMHSTAVSLAAAIPHAQYRILDGQPHEVAADVLAPVLVEFFHSL